MWLQQKAASTPLSSAVADAPRPQVMHVIEDKSFPLLIVVLVQLLKSSTESEILFLLSFVIFFPDLDRFYEVLDYFQALGAELGIEMNAEERLLGVSDDLEWVF